MNTTGMQAIAYVPVVFICTNYMHDTHSLLAVPCFKEECVKQV